MSEEHHEPPLSDKELEAFRAFLRMYDWWARFGKGGKRVFIFFVGLLMGWLALKDWIFEQLRSVSG